MSSDGTSKSVAGRIERIAADAQKAKRGDYLFRGLELSPGSSGHRTYLIIPDSISEYGRKDLYEFPLLCWDGAEIAASELQFNNRLGDGSLILTVTPESSLLLEPYRSVSVTEAVRAATCVRLADLNSRMGHDEPYWMAKGRMIHALFDHLLKNVSDRSNNAFAAVFRAARPALMEALLGSEVAVSSRELKDDARSHFERLQAWFERHRGTIDAARAEVDRISARWGLKGRADALLAVDGLETLLELKTGRVPMPDHGLQLFAYSLLFEDDDGHRPDGCLLYSADGRSESLEERAPWALVRARNFVIWLRHSYTLSGLPAHDLLAIDRCPKRGRCFARAQCVSLFGDGSTECEPQLNGTLKEYYDHWFRLLSQDLWETETRFANVLNPGTLSDRVREGVTVPVLEMKAPDTWSERDTTKRERSGSGRHGATAGAAKSSRSPADADRATLDLIVENLGSEPSPGDEVILHQGNASSPDALRGRVTDTEGQRVRILVKAPPYVLPELAGGSSFPVSTGSGAWFLDRIPFSRGREMGRHALLRFLTTADTAVISAVAHAPEHSGDNSTRDAPSFEASLPDGTGEVMAPVESVTEPAHTRDLCFAEGLRYELNEDQEIAIRNSLAAQPYHLIHGPPGTGKTRVLARLIRMCLDRGERVLAACPTNIALDRVLTSVIELGVKDFLRVGGRAAVSPELAEAMERLGNPPVLLEDLAFQETDVAKFRERVGETKLVGATAYQCAAHPMFLKQRFDRVIVDEASQLDEPSTLGVIVLAPKFVLCGDHLQLPPAVQCISPDCETDYRLEQSLFERLFLSCDGSRISRLRVQYRMNSEIQKIPSRLFYSGALVASDEAAGRRLAIDPQILEDSEINRIVDPDRPVVFVDVRGGNSGKVRPEEADLAARIVARLVSCGLPASEIGVITPYRVQQTLIRKHLSDCAGSASLVSVDTVDRFQGGEREVIILSLARSDGVTSFLADRKRLNVSLSRARSKLILLGHGHVLEEHPLFSSLLEDLYRVTIGPVP